MQFWQNWQKLRGWLTGKTALHGEKLRRRRRLRFQPLEERCLLTLVPSLIRDIAPQPIDFESISAVVAVNGTNFFAADDGLHGRELWKTDGTATGTVLVRDIAPGIGSSGPSDLINFAGKLYFSADDAITGRELWTSDGTSTGTRVVRNIDGTSSSSAPNVLTIFNGTLFFNVTEPGFSGLWKSDGTSTGTVLVHSSTTFGQPVNVNGTLFFVANSDGELWKSNGTSGGTVLVKNINPIGASLGRELTNVNGTLYFSATDGTNGVELWKSDGTCAGTTMVANIHATGDANPVKLTNVNNRLYFAARTAGAGQELWTTDGTGAGTVQLRDIAAGTLDSVPNHLVSFGGSLFFSATDRVKGYELWKSDGTSAGTVLVKDLYPGTFSGTPVNLLAVGNTLYFGAKNPSNIVSTELWRSDGTSQGTQMVTAFNPTGPAFGPREMSNANGTLYFSTDDFAMSSNKYDLWTSNGSSAGTRMILPAAPLTQPSNANNLVQIGSTTYFAASDGVNGMELWKTDGTSSGTKLVRDIQVGKSGSNPEWLTAVNGILYFAADSGVAGVPNTGNELWRSDGTCAGTFLVRDITNNNLPSDPAHLTNVNGTLLFQASNFNNGAELWVSDGTSLGTRMIADILTGAMAGSSPRGMTTVGATTFFTAQAVGLRNQLYKTDLTSQGTVLVADVQLPLFAGPEDISQLNGKLVFAGYRAAEGNGLWVSDGTSAGTRMIFDSHGIAPTSLTRVGNLIYFVGNDSVNGTELFCSDGTSSGTFLVRDIAIGTTSSTPRALVNHGGVLYFSAFDTVSGRELWKSDGTSSGTVLVVDLVSGSTGSAVDNLFNAGNVLLFQADDGITGTELWASSGTSNSTRLVRDFFPGIGSSQPVPYLVNGEIWLTANDGVIGDELYRLIDVFVAPDVSLALSTSTLAENGGTAVVTASVLQPATQAVTVNLGFSGTATQGVDYTRSAASITIPIGAMSGSITLAAVSDATFEGTESFVVEITTLVNGIENGIQQVSATIVDDDAQPSVSLSLNGSPLAENGGVAIVRATLSNLSVQPITVNLGLTGTATNNTDYSASTLGIVIPAGSLTGAMTLTGINDTTFEGNESLVVDVSGVTNGAENGVQQVTATIIDDDTQPAVNLTLLNGVLSENGGTNAVVARLTNPSTQNVTVSLGLTGTATQNVDYSASSLLIAIPAGQTSGSVTIASIDDALLEGQESVVVDVLSTTNATENGSQSVTISILDDESPNVSMSLLGGSFGENGGSAKVRIALDRTASQAVLVDLAFSGIGQFGVDYSASSASLAIQPGLLTAEITLLGLDDSIPEGTESITIDIDTVTPGQELGTQQVTANILDDVTDAFQLIGSTLTISGTSAADTLTIDYGSSTSSFTATINGGSATYSASTITFDGGGGNDTFNLTLSSLADVATLNGRSGSVTSSNYAISFSNVETASLTGNSLDRATFNDPGVVSRFTFLPTHAIMDSAAAGFLDTVIGFGGYTGNGQGNNDSLSLYGNTSSQTLTASPAQVSMSVGTLALVGNNMRNYYSYGQGGTDSATYNGTTADEVLTSTPGYSIVSSTQTLQYFVGFRNVTANSGGGVDSAKMYDSTGNDTFTSNTTTARFFGTTFDYRANGYTRMYAYQTRGSDTATLTGTAGNDRVSGTSAFVILSTSPFIQQVFNFSTVIVNAGTGTDLATLDDSTGNDTLNASGGLAELIYASGRRIQINGFDTVTARGINGSVNRRNVTGTLAYVLRFTGTWV